MLGLILENVTVDDVTGQTELHSSICPSERMLVSWLEYLTRAQG